MRKRPLLGAVEAGGTKFVCAAGRAPDAFIAEERFATTTPEETFAHVRDFFERVAREHGAFDGFGVASFGPIDVASSSAAYGTILRTPKTGWTGASFIDALALFGAPAKIDTDVNGAGLAEYAHGAGKGAGSLAYVTVGTGIGAGVIKNGEPVSGAGHYEMGHIRPPHDFMRDPFKGRCPFHEDCVEGLASGPAIIDRWGRSLADLPAGHKAFDLEAEYLAHLAATIVLTHMPERIVFGGGVMKAPGLVEKLRVATKSLLGGYVQAPFVNDMRTYIALPVLGDFAGVTGAMMLAQSAATEGPA